MVFTVQTSFNMVDFVSVLSRNNFKNTFLHLHMESKKAKQMNKYNKTETDSGKQRKI